MVHSVNTYQLKLQNECNVSFTTGDFYWKILSNGIADGYPRKISEDWDGLEGNLDASFTWSNGKTFFFKVRIKYVHKII